MKLSVLGAALLASFSLTSAAQEGAHPAHWGYAGEVGPEGRPVNGLMGVTSSTPAMR